MERDLSFQPIVNPSPRCLSPEQIDFFNVHGYLKPFRIYDDDEAARHRDYFDRLLAEIEKSADGRDAYSINGYHTKCAGVYDIATEPRILNRVEDLLGPNFVLWGSHYFCKLPGDPKAVPWHQDASYWPFDKSRTITVWLAIDDADCQNACMQVIPGTHRLGHLEWKPTRRPAALSQEIVDAERFGEPVPFELKAGEISLHADMLAHGSEPNRSRRRRCGLTLRYVPVDVRAGEGWNRQSIIVRGEDSSGHWSHHLRPEGEDPAPMPWQIRAG